MAYIGKSPDGTGVRSRFYYTQTSGGGTSVSGSSDDGTSLAFSDGAYVDVFLNGVLLVAGTDYNTTTANTIAGLAALANGDVVEVVVYDIFTVADTVSSLNGGTFSGGVTMGGTLSVTGNQTNSGTLGVNGGAGGQVAVNYSSASTVGLSLNDTNSGNLGGFLQFQSGSTLRGNIQNANNAGIHLNVGNGSVVFTQTGYTAANALDDYEEGTFTPTGSAPSGSFTSQSGSGFYTKVGNQVFVYGHIKITDVGSGSGGMNFAGFPFAGSNRSFPAGNRSGLLIIREDQRTGTFMHMFLNPAVTSGGINMGSHTVATGDTFLFSGVYHTG